MMKNAKIAIAFIFILFMAIIFTPNFSSAKTIGVSNENDLNTAITNATDGDTIQLLQSIVLTKPVEIRDKTLKIDGNRNTIMATDAESWTTTSQNSTLITAGSGGKVTLTHLTLKDSIKYGAQAYNGGYVILDDVTISNCKFGGVIVNAGTVEVVDLKLERNGEKNNNGIEIAKGFSVSTGDNQPTLIMNGKLYSTESNNVIYLAINDTLSSFEVKNTDNTVNKILISGNKVVVTDQNEKVLYESNARDDIKMEGEVLVQDVTVTIHLKDKTVTMQVKKDSVLTEDDVKSKINLEKLGLKNYALDGFYTDDKYKTKFTFGEKVTDDTAIYAKLKDKNKDTTPKTGIEQNLAIALCAITLSSMVAVILKRKVR